MNNTSSIPAASVAELMSALSSDVPRTIGLTTSVACPHSITLPPGFSLVGTDKDRSVLSFVKFGTVGDFVAEAEIITYGLGARVFNQYDGTVRNIRFKSIETFGDGSIGIQVSKPLGTIVVDESVTTHGSIGNTMVKGVNMQLPAEAFSVKPGGVVEKPVVGGSLVTYGAKVTTYAVEGGKVLAIDIKDEVLANGEASEAVLVAGNGSTPLTGVCACARAGKALVETGVEITNRTGFSTH